MKQLAKLVLILMLGASMSACAGFLGFGGDSWKEEVLLHDGQKIIVERSQSYGGRHEFGQPDPIKEHTISFSLPGSDKQISWVSEYGEDIGRTNFQPLALQVLNGVPYVIAEPYLCLSYNKWGRPNPPYVIFKHDGKVWQRITLSELPVAFSTINMAVHMPWDVRDGHAVFDKGNLLLADSVKRRNQEIKAPEKQSILREPIRSAGEGCGELIRKGNGGWDGIGWFRDQPSKEACFKYCEQEEVSAKNCPCNRFFKGE